MSVLRIAHAWRCLGAFLGLGGCCLLHHEDPEIASKCTDISNVIGKNYKLGANFNYLLVGGGVAFERSGIALTAEAAERQLNIDRLCRQWVKGAISNDEWLSVSTKIAVASAVSAARSDDPTVIEKLSENLEDLQSLMQSLANAKSGDSGAALPVRSTEELKKAIADARRESDLVLRDQLNAVVDAVSLRVEVSNAEALRTYRAALEDQKLLDQQLIRSTLEFNRQLASLQINLKAPPRQINTLAQPPSQVFRIEFDTGRSQLTPKAQEKLQAAIPPRLFEQSGYLIEVNGYADTSGKPATNAKLSLARAQIVRDYLVDELKLEPGNIAIYGRQGGVSKFGPDHASNRVVELKIFLKEPEAPGTNPANP
jgi:outer membrane protein OmpA-like peptidoglycan-associated protein